MPNRLPKLWLLCAFSVIASPPAVAQTGGKAGASYHPPIRIETNPATFPLTGKVSVTASVFNKTSSGAHPPGIKLRVVPADASGNYPATGGKTYPAGSVPSPIGSQNGVGWSNATFDNVDVPSPAQKIAMVADYVTWSAALQRYIRTGGAETHGVAIFRKRCLPVNKTSICSWRKE